jgi:hypothetical protein
VGNGEDHMTVGDGEQLLRSFRRPAITRGGLALGATAIATRVVGDAAMATAVTLLDVTAQSGRAADANILEGLALLWRDGVTPAVQEPLSIPPKKLGHLEPRSAHLLRSSPSEFRISRIGRASRGLGTVWKRRSET